MRVLLYFTLISSANAAIHVPDETRHMVSAGQGVSSPGFWNALSGANPAGLAFNQSHKIQGGVAAVDRGASSAQGTRGSAGLILGNGLFSAGVEFSRYNRVLYPSQFIVHWGVAGRFDGISTTFGFSGHQGIGAQVTPTFSAGLLVDLGSRLRFGAMAGEFSATAFPLDLGLNFVAGGFTLKVANPVDLVGDAIYETQRKKGIVKPAMTLHLGDVQASGSYGILVTGDHDEDDVFERLTFGVGYRVAKSLILSYEYRGLIQHRLGLTLRFK